MPNLIDRVVFACLPPIRNNERGDLNNNRCHQRNEQERQDKYQILHNLEVETLNLQFSG